MEKFPKQSPENSNEKNTSNSSWNGSFPAFDPIKAQELKKNTEESPETRFDLDPKDFSIFPQQSEFRYNEYSHKHEDVKLNFNETVGSMVGRTAATIAVLNGEGRDQDRQPIPKADHVIYLDKSARPVSWLVDEFWSDFSDTPEPEGSFLAIDRKDWWRRCGVKFDDNEYVKNPDGSSRPANASDFNLNKIPEETRKRLLAGIRALYIEGGIENEDPDKIMQTPTSLDGKNVTIIDEVSRSGATLEIAKQLIKEAIPKIENISGYVFWQSGTHVTNNGETQMNSTPAWYPHDKNDWRGRGSKGINEQFFIDQFNKEPTDQHRAEKFGAFVLSEPLLNPEDEPGQPSRLLQEDIKKLRIEYDKGHILPSTEVLSRDAEGTVQEKMIEQLENWGVKFTPDIKDKKSYLSLAAKRDYMPGYIKKA